MKIGIAGVGGIGSNVAVNLVRAGCTSLLLVDFDRVERGNLNRQFYFADQIGKAKVEMLRDNLLRITPEAEIEAVQLRLSHVNMAETFADCRFLVEGFDDQESKKQLVEVFAGRDLPIVSASGIAGNDLAAIRVHRLGNCTIVGDFASDFRHNRLYCPKVSIIAAMMADIVLQQGELHG